MSFLLIEEDWDDNNFRNRLLNLIKRNQPEQATPAPQLFINDTRVAEHSVTSHMIVCGNCAGEGELPHKTFLTREGRCDNCGGNSYVFASEFSKTNTWRQIWQQLNNQ